jgi:hypothetical protein
MCLLGLMSHEPYGSHWPHKSRGLMNLMILMGLMGLLGLMGRMDLMAGARGPHEFHGSYGLH